MSLATATGRAMPKGSSRASFRDQVLMHLIGWGCGDALSASEEAKIARVQRFLPAADCAREIREKREAM